jgi:hypothetical protein
LNPRTFSLAPFRGEESLPDLAITGTIGRSAETMSIGCAVAGNLSALAVPAAAVSRERKDRLWEETCLEFFLGAKGSEGYWEFNLSPAGHWNVYRFASYRKGMREEPAFPSLPFGIRSEPGVLRLSLGLDLGRILPAGATVEAGVCAVIRTTTGGTSHWALAHPGPRPDFHRRDGFALTLRPTLFP